MRLKVVCDGLTFHSLRFVDADTGEDVTFDCSRIRIEGGCGEAMRAEITVPLHAIEFLPTAVTVRIEPEALPDKIAQRLRTEIEAESARTLRRLQQIVRDSLQDSIRRSVHGEEGFRQ